MDIKLNTIIRTIINQLMFTFPVIEQKTTRIGIDGKLLPGEPRLSRSAKKAIENLMEKDLKA